MEKVDVAIIGEGPAGLSTAVYLSRSAYSSLLIEQGAPGGRLLTLPEVENYPGFQKVSGMALASSFLEAARSLGAKEEYGQVKSVSRNNGTSFMVETDVDTIEAKAVVVATGLSFVPSIKGEKELVSHGVSYCATCDGRFYKGKVMAVVGNGDKAIEEALYLAPLSSSLHFFSKDKLTGSSKMLELLSSSKNVTIHENALILEIRGQEKVESCVYEEKDMKHELSIDAIFPFEGAKSVSAFLSPLSPKMEKGFLIVDENMETSVPGLFAAGDIVKKALRQIVTAASDGAIASSGVIKYLNKRKDGQEKD